MKTVLISGNDTDIGKTWVCRALVKYLVAHDQSIQVVKVVETGISNHQKGDAEIAITNECNSIKNKSEAYTLYSFQDPLAPVSASRKVDGEFNYKNVICKIENLPDADWRIIETAGGLAVPLDPTGLDAVDLALNLSIDYLLLVVQNRLGAIHQARVLTAYAPYSIITTGIWFNDRIPVDDEITHSNYTELSNLAIPIWGHQLYQMQALRYFDLFPIAQYFKD